MNPAAPDQIKTLIQQYCSKEWIELVEERSIHQSYEPKTLIFAEKDPVEYISLVNNGIVKIFNTYNDQKEKIYRFAVDGQIIGHRGLGGNYKYPVSAISITPTSIVHIPLELFQNTLKANALFCYHFMIFLANELRKSEKDTKDLAKLNLLERIAGVLMMHISVFGYNPKEEGKLGFTISRKDMASMASTTYESVIRTLTQLQKQGLIKLEGKEIRIVDQKRLRAVAKA